MSALTQYPVRRAMSQVSLIREDVRMVHPPGGRTRRVVKYRRGVDVWEQVSGMRRLPGPYLVYDDPGYPRP